MKAINILFGALIVLAQTQTFAQAKRGVEKPLFAIEEEQKIFKQWAEEKQIGEDLKKCRAIMFVEDFSKKSIEVVCTYAGGNKSLKFNTDYRSLVKSIGLITDRMRVSLDPDSPASNVGLDIFRSEILALKPPEALWLQSLIY